MEEFSWTLQEGVTTHFFKNRLTDFTNEWLDLDKVIDPTNHTDTFLGDLATEVRRQSAGQWKSDSTTEIRKVVEKVIVDDGGGFASLMSTIDTYHAPASILEGIYYREVTSENTDWDAWGDCNSVPAANRNVRNWCPTPVYGQVPESRAGLLNRAALLIQMQPESVPVHRGAFVRKKLLCESIELPSDIPLGDLVAPAPDLTKSKRDRWHERTSPASCHACHVRINPVGFIMDEYDSIGRRVLTETLTINGSETTVDKVLSADPLINDSGVSNVNNTVELSQALANSKTAQVCFVEQWLDYSAGVQNNTANQCLIEDMWQIESRTTEGGLIRMFRTFVLREAFRNRLVE